MRYNKDAPESSRKLLPPGQYEAVVTKAEEGFSQKGNAQMALVLTVYGPGGEESTVFDYLPATDSSFWKLKHFCESAGIPVDGDLLESQAENANVRVDLGIQKDKSGAYPDKNNVKDYLPRVGNGVAAEQDQDIPFSVGR